MEGVLDANAWVGVVGTLITIAAFGLTIFQLRRTATATQAAKTAIVGLQTRMTTFDLATESLKASTSLQHSVKLLKLGRLDDAAASIWEAQISLNRIGSLMPEAKKIITAEELEILIETVSDLEDAAVKGVDYDSRSLTVTLRKTINQLEAEYLSRNKEIVSHA